MSGDTQKNFNKGEINADVVKIGDENNYYQAHIRTFPKELTLNLPKTHPNDIIGRENDLDELHQLLCTEKHVVLVNGLGGIGKTTLAQTYIHKYYDDYNHIAWIVQDSDNIANDFVNTAGLIDNLAIDQTAFEPQQLFAEVIRQMKNISDKPNLLIIDNVGQSLSLCLDMLPSQPHWHLLVTSRQKIIGLFIKELDFLSQDETIKLFKKHYTHKKLSDSHIKEVVKMVDRHTLTVEILAKTAEELRYDIDKLQNAIKNDLKANLNVAHNRKHSQIEKISSYLGTVFNLSNLNEAEIWLMKQFVCLPSEFHKYELLEEILIKDNDPDGIVFAESLNNLVRKGWLLQKKETDSYKMHRIIADVTKKQQIITVADVEILVEAIEARLNVDDTRDNPTDKFIWVPFGKALLANFGEETYTELKLLQNNLALRLIDLGDYLGSKLMLEKFLASDEKYLSPDHPDISTGYSNLATVLQELGDYRGAKNMQEKAVAHAEKSLGSDHPITAIRYSILASILQDLGDFQGAKSLLEKAIVSDEKTFGKEHPTTTKRYSNLALVLQDLGDLQGAKVLLEKVNLSDEKNFGPDHPTTATGYSNLAVTLDIMEDYVSAKILSEKAVVSTVNNFGVDHPTTAIRYSNLALVLQHLGDYQGARVLLEKATVSNEKTFGVNHPRTATRYHNLAGVLYELEEYNSALTLSNKALIIFKKTLPAGHPSIETVLWWNELIKSKIK